jgi:hypothetical protein
VSRASIVDHKCSTSQEPVCISQLQKLSRKLGKHFKFLPASALTPPLAGPSRRNLGAVQILSLGPNFKTVLPLQNFKLQRLYFLA